MTAPHYQDDTLTLHHGDAGRTMAQLEPGSIACIVTSPPYYGLRDYGIAGQLGIEPTPEDYVENLTAILRTAHRALADDGTMWLNIGDTYRNKQMLGMPWRVALALQADGWILRNDIIWAKPNAMPESVHDRLSNRHEHLFLLTKARSYWFDLDPIRETYTGTRAASRRARSGNANKENTLTSAWTGNGTRNPGDVWTLPTQPFPGAHFATFPTALPERCIRAGCKPGGTVLDPFSGSGTTGAAAARLGHPYIGIDLNADYLDLSLRTRLTQPTLALEGTRP